MITSQQYLTFYLGLQLCGLPVALVHDVAKGGAKLTRVPPAPKAVLGLRNLRGRIATAISLKHLLELPDAPQKGAGMDIVVEHKGDLYSLAVDAVGAVLSVGNGLEQAPATLDAVWQKAVAGVSRQESELLAVLDIPSLLDALCVPDEAPKESL